MINKNPDNQNKTALRAESRSGKEVLSMFARDWDGLFERSVGAPPYLSRAWIGTFISEGRLRGTPLFILVWDGEKLVALLALAIRRFCGVKIAELVGTGEPSYLGILLDPAYREAVGSVVDLFMEQKIAQVFYNSSLFSEDQATNELLDEFQKNNFLFLRAYRDPCHCISLGTSYEEYLQKKSSKARKKLRKEKRRLFKYGDVKVFKYKAEDISPEVLCRIAAIQQESRLKRHKADVLGQPFYQRILLDMGKAGFGKIWLMTINGQDAAFKYTFVAHNKLYLHWTAFDLKYTSSNVSVGKVLTMLVIEDACDDGILLADFLHGDGNHKRFWGNKTNSVHRVIAGRGFRGRLMAIGYFIVWKLAEIGWLRSKYRNVRKRLRSLFSRRNESSW